jgi:hypothetical protein
MQKMSLALLAGASLLIAAPRNAMAIDGAPRSEPVIYYSYQPQRPAPERTYSYRPPQPAPERAAYAQRSGMGGGFIEFLFGDNAQQDYQREQLYQQQPDDGYGGRRALLPYDPQQQYRQQQEEAADPAQRRFDPKYEKQVVDYQGKEGSGTIVVDTPNKFLYLVQGDGKALRYGIGVGPASPGRASRPSRPRRNGRTGPCRRKCWRAVRIAAYGRRAVNPLGARAMYLGSSLYRIHGSNEPHHRHQRLSGCATRTSSTSTAASTSARGRW